MKYGKWIIKKFYSSMTRKAEKLLLPHYPEVRVSEITKAIESKYGGVIQRLPYVGGLRNFYTPIIIINGWFVCIYKAMHSIGIEDAVIGYVISEATDDLFDHVPGFLAKRIKKIVFSGFFKRVIQKQAKKSRRMKFAGDWVYSVEFPEWGSRGDEREIKLVFNECGVHKYYEQEKCEALKKYCNFCDPQYSIRYKLGLDANHTMAQGCKKCILAFNNKRETVLPDNITQMNKKAQMYLNDCKHH